jgi:hypothetical protein
MKSVPVKGGHVILLESTKPLHRMRIARWMWESDPAASSGGLRFFVAFDCAD